MNRKVRNRWLATSLMVCGLAGSAVVLAAAPVVSSATLSNGKLTISGSNFGSKPTAAPYRFWPFTADADGASSKAVGFDFYNSVEAGSVIVSTDGVGGKSLKFTALGAGQASNVGKFPMIGENLPGGTTGVLCSVWFKLHRQGTAVSGGTMQWKGPRTGVYGANSADPTDNYAASPHLSASIFTAPDFTWTAGTNSSGFNSYIDYEYPNSGSSQFNNPDPPNFGLDQWYHWETWYRFNDVGQANGEMVHTLNGTVIAKVSNLQNRTTSSQYLQHIIVLTGLAFLQNRDWDIYMSRVYLDTTKAQVFLCNAAALASCTGRFVVPPSAWTNTSISGTDATNIPAGYKWIYVSNPEGEINATGFEFAAGPVPMAPVVMDS